jgi:hypothetical protein
MRTWIPIVAVAVSALGLAGLPMVPMGGGGQTVVASAGGSQEVEVDPIQRQFDQAMFFRRGLKPEKALETYRTLLADRSLSPQDQAKTLYLIGQTYETMPNQGESACLTYQHLRDMYPTEPLAWYAAKRHGNLLTSLALSRGKKDLKQAKEQFEWVLKQAPAGSHVALLAHMNLGQILTLEFKGAEALPHFRAIYDADSDTVDTPPAVIDLRDLPQPVVRDVAEMRERVVAKMVDTCWRPKPGDHRAALKALAELYPDDARITAAVKKAQDTLANREKTPQPADPDAHPDESDDSPAPASSSSLGLISMLDPFWDPTPSMTETGPTILDPNGRYLWVHWGQEVECRASRATDWDTYWDEYGQDTVYSDQMIPDGATFWTCTMGEGGGQQVGGWGGEVFTGPEVVWIAPPRSPRCALSHLSRR